jgi:hypothetical protein
MSFTLVAADGHVFLSADDVVSYEWGHHRLVLREGVRQRLVRELVGDLVSGRPFTVVAGGQKCYEGVFTTSLSSNTQSGVVIDLQPVEQGAPNQVELQLGYPSAQFFRGIDPRGDQRIRQALEGLRKLK